MDKFDRAFSYAIKNEGDYANHKRDRGGPTRYGITIGTLSAWRGDAVYANEVAKLTVEEAKDIYRAWYWNNMGLDHVPENIGVALFDAGILFGVTAAVREAQTVLVEIGFKIKVDGILGIVSQDCLCHADPKLFILGFQHRLGKLVEAITKKNPSQNVFKLGWNNRLERLESLIA